MSQQFDLYLPRDSWLHQMDPRAKLWAVLLAGTLGLLFKQIGLLLALLLVANLALFSARIPLDRIRWFWARLVPLLVLILILHHFHGSVTSVSNRVVYSTLSVQGSLSSRHVVTAHSSTD